MRLPICICLAMAWSLGMGVCWAQAQSEFPQDLPTVLRPLKPLTKQELAQREARKVFGLALMRQREDRLIEATRLFEEARQLEPESAAIQRALIPLYLALSRQAEAIEACRKTLEKDPGDHETWALLARQLKLQSKPTEAQAALERALQCHGLNERLDLRAQYAHDLGTLYEDTKDQASAIRAYLEVVKALEHPQALTELTGYTKEVLDEHAASTYERVIRLCIEANRFDQALAVFAETQKKYPILARRLNLNLARLHLAQGRPEQALRHLDDFLQAQPPAIEGYELKIAILQQLGKSEEILPALEQHAQRDPHLLALQLLLARQYAREKKLGNAEQIYQKVLTQSPTPEAYRGLFATYLAWREGAGAEQILQLFDDAMVRAAGRSGDGKDGDPQAAAQGRAMLGALREDSAQARAVIAAANQWLVKGRDLNSQTRHFMAVLATRAHLLPEAELFYRRSLAGVRTQQEFAIYSGLLQVLWEAKKYEAVIEVCEQGLKQARATHRLLFHDNLSRALVMLGRYEEGLAQADQAVEIARSSDEYLLHSRLNRITMLSLADRCPQAVKEGMALLKDVNAPGDIRRVRYALSNVYSTMRDMPHAEEQLQLILKADPNDATANNDLGYLWADQGKNLEEAERLIRKALELDRVEKKRGPNVDIDADKENAAYLDSLAWVLFRRGKMEQARDLLEKAATLSRGDDDPVIWDHLGDVCFRLGDQVRARSSWEKALTLYENEKRRKLDEHYKELKQKLKLLSAENRQPS